MTAESFEKLLTKRPDTNMIIVYRDTAIVSQSIAFVQQAPAILGGTNMVFEKIKTILAEQLDIEPENITMDSGIMDDLGADSLDIVDLVMAIEDEFEVEIPDEQIESIKTVGDVVNYITEHQ